MKGFLRVLLIVIAIPFFVVYAVLDRVMFGAQKILDWLAKEPR